jgi:hypothetical protein
MLEELACEKVDSFGENFAKVWGDASSIGLPLISV